MIVGWLVMTFLFALIYGTQAYNTWFASDDKLKKNVWYGGWTTTDQTRASRKRHFKLLFVGYILLSVYLLFFYE